MTEDIPDGLPSVRSISHCMDLILGASFPNKAPYRLTSIENEELNRQVHELLQKGLIREILSPCVVLAILAPKRNGECRMCIDSRAINKIIVKYKFPMPRMDDIMDCLSGVTNKVVDALSRRCSLLTEMKVEVLGYDEMKELYDANLDFFEA